MEEGFPARSNKWEEQCMDRALGGTQFRTTLSLPFLPKPSFFLLQSVLRLGPLAKFSRFPLFLVQQKNYTFRCLQMSSFANRSWSRTDSVVWLGDLQTHRWSNDSDTISFTKPWSQGKLSDQQWEKLQHMFQVYRVSFTRDIQELVKMMSPKEDCEWRDWNPEPSGRE